MSTLAESLTLDQLLAHPYFVRLSPKQKVFVEQLCRNGNNKVAAAHKAWQCKDDDSARSFANKTLNKADVRWLVSKFFGIAAEDEPFTRDEMMTLISRKIRTVNDEKLVYNYIRAYMDMNGWEMKPADPAKTDAPASRSMMDEVIEAEQSLPIPKPRNAE